MSLSTHAALGKGKGQFSQERQVPKDALWIQLKSRASEVLHPSPQCPPSVIPFHCIGCGSPHKCSAVTVFLFLFFSIFAPRPSKLHVAHLLGIEKLCERFFAFASFSHIGTKASHSTSCFTLSVQIFFAAREGHLQQNWSVGRYIQGAKMGRFVVGKKGILLPWVSSDLLL